MGVAIGATVCIDKGAARGEANGEGICVCPVGKVIGSPAGVEAMAWGGSPPAGTGLDATVLGISTGELNGDTIGAAFGGSVGLEIGIVTGKAMGGELNVATLGCSMGLAVDDMIVGCGGDSGGVAGIAIGS